MKQIQVTDMAAHSIEMLRINQSEDFYFKKSQIADAMTTVSTLIEVGRDDSEISFLADNLLSVLNVLSSYVFLLNKLEPTEERNATKYEIQISEE